MQSLQSLYLGSWDNHFHLIISFYTSSAVQSLSRVRLCEKPLDCSTPGIPASSLLLDGCDFRTVLRHRNWNHMTKQQQPYYNFLKITGSFLHDFFKQMSDSVCNIQRRVRKHCWYSRTYPLQKGVTLTEILHVTNSQRVPPAPASTHIHTRAHTRICKGTVKADHFCFFQ